MFKALLRTRLAALGASLFRGSKNKKKRGPLAKAGMAILMVYLVGCFFFMFSMLWSSICVPFYQAGLSWLYFGLVGLVSAALCFIGSVFMAQTQLYSARDNDLLLSMPIPPSAILGSRMAMLLLLNYFYSALVVIPAAAIWCANLPVTVAGAVFFAMAFLALPLLPLTLSCLFGWVIAAITSRMRNKNLITMVLSMAFLFAYFYFYSNIQNYINALVANGAAIADAMRTGMPPVYWLGNAIASASPLSLVLFLLCCAVPFVLVYAALSASFIGIATERRTAAKRKYQRRALRVSSADSALFHKELVHLGSSSMYMLNAGIGLVMMVGVSVLALVKNELLLEMFGMGGATGMLGALACAILCFMLSMVCFSAPSISLEGKSLWIAQSLPVEAGQILEAKARLHWSVSLPFVLLSGLLMNLAVRPEPLIAIAMFLLPAAVCFFFAYLGVVINLRFPKFDWINETAAVKQGASTIIAMLAAMVCAAIPLILFVILPENAFPVGPYLLIWAVVFGLCALWIRRFLRHRGARMFEELSV